MDTTEPTIVNISTTPSTKEQLVGYALGLAFIAGTVVVTAVTISAVEKVQQKLFDRKLRKLQDDQPNED